MCSFLACVMCSFLACVLCSSSATARPSAAACTWLQVVPGGGVEIMGVQTHGIFFCEWWCHDDSANLSPFGATEASIQ